MEEDSPKERTMAERFRSRNNVFGGSSRGPFCKPVVTAIKNIMTAAECPLLLYDCAYYDIDGDGDFDVFERILRVVFVFVFRTKE